MPTKIIYALGFFDGVHIGHGALLKACRTLAQQQRCRCGVITFSSHPDALVSGAAPGLINTSTDREVLMKACYGVDTIVELPFDRALMAMPWQAFYGLLQTKYEASGFVCGEDFRFGAGGNGSAALLQEACRKDGLPCTVVPVQTLDGITVSSTYIRQLLTQGELTQANRFLGHPHRLTGTVLPGQQLGRTLGFPTANLVLPEGLLCPRHGVYACMAYAPEGAFPAVTNIGCRPTVGGSSVTVEAHLLGYRGDLYGKTVTLEFHRFLRPEKKFPSLEALQAEIQKNKEQTLEFFQKI